MDKDLDPLRELAQADDFEESVSAPTEMLSSLESSRNAPTSRMGRPAQEVSSRGAPPPRSESPSRGNHQSLIESRAGEPAPAMRLPSVRQPSGASGRTNFRNSPRANIRDNYPRRPVKRKSDMGPILGVFTLGIAVAFVALGVIRYKDRIVTPIQNTATTGSNASSTTNVVEEQPQSVYLLEETATFVEPLFGQVAVKRCTERCEAQTGAIKDSCVLGCNMYQIQNYGRRITFDRFDAYADGQELVNRCSKKEFSLPPHISGSRWNEELQSTLKLIDDAPGILKENDHAKISALYTNLLKTNLHQRMPPAGTSLENALTKDIVRGTCLLANMAHIQLAVATVQANNDNYSLRYYRQMLQSTEPKALEMGQSILSQAKALKIQY